jgi:putative flippase GtrA
MAIGGLAFVGEYLSFLLILSYASPENRLLVAQTLSFCMGLAISFSGNRLYTFKQHSAPYHHAVHRQLFAYSMLALANLILSNIAIHLLTQKAGLNSAVAKIIVMLMVVLWNYVIFKKYIFKTTVKE